jgi:hypothetical protein
MPLAAYVSDSDEDGTISRIQVTVNAFDIPGLEDDPVYEDFHDGFITVREFKEIVEESIEPMSPAQLHFFVGGPGAQHTKELNDFRQLGYYTEVSELV